MKVRVGFVSNSSSSSFCIYGLELTGDDVADIVNEKNKNENTPLDAWDVFTEIPGIDWANGLNEYCEDSIIVGLSVYAIQDDETLASFKKRTLVAIRKAFPDMQVADYNLGWHTDGGYS